MQTEPRPSARPRPQQSGIYRQIRNVSVAGILVTLGAGAGHRPGPDPGPGGQRPGPHAEHRRDGGRQRAPDRSPASDEEATATVRQMVLGTTEVDLFPLLRRLRQSGRLLRRGAGRGGRRGAAGAGPRPDGAAAGQRGGCAQRRPGPRRLPTTAPTPRWRTPEGRVVGYAMAGIYLHSIRQTVGRTLVALPAGGHPGAGRWGHF